MSDEVFLRPADAGDWARLYAWRIDPTVRENSRVSSEFTIGEHMGWLHQRLADPKTKILIACREYTGEAIGTGRLDFDGFNCVEISIAIDPEWRGIGYGARTILALTHAVAGYFPTAQKVSALVLATNTASLRAFATAGFVPSMMTRTFEGDDRLWIGLVRQQEATCENGLLAGGGSTTKPSTVES